jgi:hypothetical protein
MKIFLSLFAFFPLIGSAQIDTNPPATTQVYFPTWGFSGVSQRSPLTLTPVNNWLRDGDRIMVGKPILVTNVPAIVRLFPNDYDVSFQGINGSTRLHVYSSTNVLSAAWLSSNLVTYTFTAPVGPWDTKLLATNDALLAALVARQNGVATNPTLVGQTRLFDGHGNELLNVNQTDGAITFSGPGPHLWTTRTEFDAEVDLFGDVFLTPDGEPLVDILASLAPKTNGMVIGLVADGLRVTSSASFAGPVTATNSQFFGATHFYDFQGNLFMDINSTNGTLSYGTIASNSPALSLTTNGISSVRILNETTGQFHRIGVRNIDGIPVIYLSDESY